MAKTTVVTFVKDVFPHCTNDVVALTDDELKSIDAKAYVKGELLEGEEVKEAPSTKKTKK